MNAVVLSIDAELGWGFHDLEEPPADRIEASRSGWRTLLGLCDEFDVPATWGVVGHLLLEDCHGVHESHPLGPNWFAREREDWADRADVRFARDLVRATLTADADHELGFQTFSHVEFGDENVSADLARAECAAFFDALEEAAEAGAVGDDHTSPVSALFPRDAVGHRDVLAEWGFECYCGEPLADDADYPLGDTLRTLAQATVSAPPIAEPSVDDYGLVTVPPSLRLFDVDDRAYRLAAPLGRDPMVAAARRGVDRVAAEGGAFHLSLHPHDLLEERDVQRVRDVLSYVAGRRDDGDVDVQTLGEIAEEVQPTIAVDPPEVRP